MKGPGRAVGRGTKYSRRRAVLERVAALVYRGGWPGRVWGRLPGRTAVDLVQHRLEILPASAAVDGDTHAVDGPPGDPATGDRFAARGRPGRTLRVAFASDFHIGPITPPALLDNAFALLAATRPDVLVLGGDYVFLDATPTMAAELERRVAAVPAAVKLAVMGNHDLWTRHDRIEEALRRAGATVLINQAVHLPAPFNDVAVVGLDDPWTGTPDPDAALEQAAGAALKLGVAHSPEALTLLAGRGLRLLLCGHTHGGQIASPWGPILVHGAEGRRRPAGLYTFDDGMRMFVSRGLGNVELPLRIYARPDVSLFTLVAPAIDMSTRSGTT